MTKAEYRELLIATSAAGLFPAIDGGGSTGKSIRCRYRAENGRRCAAGVLLPPDKCGLGMEGQSVSAVFDCNPSLRQYLLFSDLNEDTSLYLISKVQRIHDTIAREKSLDSGWSHENFVELIDVVFDSVSKMIESQTGNSLLKGCNSPL